MRSRCFAELDRSITHAAEETEEDESRSEAAEILVTVATHDPDLVMLIRPRKSRIYYLRKFFDYPITLTATTLKNLGIGEDVSRRDELYEVAR